MPANPRSTPRLDRAGTALTLLLPLFLLHGRGVAEALAILLSALFLLRCALLRDASWLRSAWARIALAWWAWLLVCSAPWGAAALAQSAGLGRFLLLAAALESWTLRTGTARRWLARILRWSAYYLALQCLVQFATGRNLFGFPRGADGELTGPYRNPRVGPVLSRLFFPAILAPLLRGVSRRGWQAAGAVLLLLVGIAVMVLVGQRMPLLLVLLGLFVTALLLPALRGVVLAACVAAGLVLGVSSAVSPRTFNRLVTKFGDQLEHFPTSDYGRIATRAVAIAREHPLLGTGFDGFRRECVVPAYFRSWDGGDGGGAGICVQHPHNYYLQALVEGGVPGLLLFAALAAAWLLRLSRHLWRDPAPARVGLFVAALLQLWPIASSTAFTSMPLAGWFFVLLGLGLAETKHYISATKEA